MFSATAQSRDERRAAGKLLRDRLPRRGQSEWNPASRRFDPIKLIEHSNKGRLENLIPIRHGRMMSSPFAFYRGSAALMAADLANTPNVGLNVQACGDCHLLNFGGFATPERNIIFDINDFDETLPAPFEWDLKRLTASFIIAARNNRLSEEDARTAAMDVVRKYREHLSTLAEMTTLEAWYSRLDLSEVIERTGDEELRKMRRKRLEKALSRNPEDEFPKLAHFVEDKPRIKDDPPLIYHLDSQGTPAFEKELREGFMRYRESLPDDRRILLDRYQLVDYAMKVVGVGSVGTRCAVILLVASNDDHLFLQVKQARPSVLEKYTSASVYPNHGQRVVVGQRLMQAASDIFLGWARGSNGRDVYVRQLRDVKLKPLVEIFDATSMAEYARACGAALARAHARSLDPALLAGYTGGSERLDEALADFAVAYADQNEKDYDTFLHAIRSGRLTADADARL